LKPILESKDVLLIQDCSIEHIQSFLDKFHLELQLVKIDSKIPGSFWGESEAGLISNTIFVRKDTPIHSLLHETCHYICMDEQRRKALNTNAKGNSIEESAVCYLQILLADEIEEMNKKSMMRDMDKWGYSFRLGSTRAWFENDAEDAKAWLFERDLIDNKKQPNYKLRK